MTERRPHWDDDLVYAVIHEIGVLRPSPHSLRDTAYAVIAAVEDWQIAKAGPGKYAITLGVIGGKYLPEWIAQSAIDRATKSEAAIARVREFRMTVTPNTDYNDGYNRALEDAKRALDGPCPTCRGPIRETVGLVCQTCGTDYGRLDGTA